MAAGEEKDSKLRIVLVGKTGVGKSAAGNSILGRKEFKSALSSSSVTSECDKATGEVDGRKVAVVDTPGLFDTNFTKEEIIKKIALCISLSSPGPHAFLVVLQLGRFTQEEQDTVEIIQKTFGPQADQYTMVLFTHGDQLEGTKIEDFISGNAKISEFISTCHGGYHVFNNEDEGNRSQVTELLEKIEKMVALNGGGCYTTEMYKEAERAIEKEKEKILKETQEAKRREEEELRKHLKGEALEQARKELSERYEREAREKAEKDNLFIRMAPLIGLGFGVVGGVATGAVLGALVGGPAGAVAGAAIGLSSGAAAGAVIGAGVSQQCTIQ